MQLQVISSSSSGNAYLLTANDGETLLIEAGIPLNRILRALLPKAKNIAACLLTHEHTDHARAVPDLIARATPVYTSIGTANHLQQQHCKSHFYHPIPECTTVQIGTFKVIPFPVQHDAVQPYGYLIHHPEMGTLLFATDTYYLHYRFKRLNHILIECNYQGDILQANYQSGAISRQRYERTLRSHMSYAQLLSTLQANDLTAVTNIMLIHLSNANANAPQMIQGVSQAAPQAKVSIATPKLSLTLSPPPPHN